MMQEVPASGDPHLSGWWRPAVTLLMLLAVLGPWVGGIPIPGYWSGWDSNFALGLVRAYEFSLRHGQWFPNWLPMANNGLGSPALYFYGRLPFLVSGILGVTFRLGAPAALALAFVLFRFLSFYLFRLWLRRSLSRTAADVGALTFLCLPFAMLVNPVLRVGFAETCATAFLPVLFLLIEMNPSSGMKRLAQLLGLALTWATLACTHLPQTLLAFGCVSLYAILLRRWMTFAVNVAAVALGLALSAVYVLPAVLLQPLITSAAWSSTPFISLAMNFLFSRERYFLYHLHTIDLMLYGTWFLCVGILVWSLGSQVSKVDRRFRSLQVLAAVCLLAMTVLTRPLWALVPQLQIIQFPWRLFPAVIVAVSALVAFRADADGRCARMAVKVAGVLAVGQVALVLLGVLISWSPRTHFPLYARKQTPFYVGWAHRDDTPNSRPRENAPEYLPIWATRAGWKVVHDLDATAPASLPDDSFAYPSTLQVSRADNGDWLIAGHVDSPHRIVLRMFYFPDERAVGDQAGNVPVPVDLDPASGLAAVMVPSGAVSLRVVHDLPLSPVVTGRRISVAALFVLLVFAGFLLWDGFRQGRRGRGLGVGVA